MSAVEKYEETTIHPLPARTDMGQTIEQFGSLATQIARTEFVPADFKGRPEAVLACMLYGQELGLGPMQSLNLIQSIKGRVGLKPEGMRGVVKQAGHRIWPEEYSDEKVTLCGWRQGDPADVVVKVTWTMQDAQRAGLASGTSWKNYPRAMLTARATSELCRLHFADVIGGLSYTPEELEHFDAAPDMVMAPMASAAPDESPAPAARRTRSQPVPEGMLPASQVKTEMVNRGVALGLTTDEAKRAAAELWAARGFGSQPVSEADRDDLLLVITDSVAADGEAMTDESPADLDPGREF